MIEVWASHKSFVRKDGSGPERPPGRNPEVDFKGEKRSNKTHHSTTDPEARRHVSTVGADKAFGVSHHPAKQVKRALEALIERGEVRFEGNNRWRRYWAVA